MLKRQGLGVVGHALKGYGREHGARSGGRILMGHLVLKGGGLKSPDSQQPPAGRGHGVNQRCLNGITRLKLENERGSQIVEAARRQEFRQHRKLARSHQKTLRRRRQYKPPASARILQRELLRRRSAP